MHMSELIVKPGNWNSFNASETEAFLATVSRMLGFTPDQQAFLKRVHDNIHGDQTPDKYYSESLNTLISWIPTMILPQLKKHCDENQKKQVKIWYNELINLDSAKNHPFCQLLIPPLTQMVDQL